MVPLPLTRSWWATWLAVTRHGGFDEVGSLESLLILHGCSSLMWWKNWLINRLGSLVIIGGPRQAGFFHGPTTNRGCIMCLTLSANYFNENTS